jgi:hypothetical protein
MRSSAESIPTPGASRGGFWSMARGHYFLGLFLLLSVWLFAVTGFLLNHSTWGLAERQRTQTNTTAEHAIVLPRAGSPLTDALDLMRQLGITGEIQWLATKSEGDQFDFRVTRPGKQIEVRTNLKTSKASVVETEVNALGITRALHVFTGVRLNDPRNERDWLITKLWAWSMDGIAVGLLALVASGIWIWVRSGNQRLPGWIALGSGILVCGWFVAGIARLMS